MDETTSPERATHTPGLGALPWRFEAYMFNAGVVDSAGRMVASVFGDPGGGEGPDVDVRDAGVLIASAPALLTALRTLIDRLDPQGDCGKLYMPRDEWIAEARAAIAAATGAAS